jgi:hypothetical protein
MIANFEITINVALVLKMWNIEDFVQKGGFRGVPRFF